MLIKTAMIETRIDSLLPEVYRLSYEIIYLQEKSNIQNSIIQTQKTEKQKVFQEAANSKIFNKNSNIQTEP